MKTLIPALILAFSFILPFFGGNTTVSASTAPQEAPVCMTVNGRYIKTDTPACLKDGYTLIPIRSLSNALSADSVTWNEKTSSATIQRKGTVIVLTKNSKTALVNNKKVSMDTKAQIMNGRFYVPVRFVAETFDTRVSWDASTYTVNITAAGVTVPQSMVGSRGYSDQDLYWLSRIVHAESQGEPMKGKIGVANVVINRVKSPLYDDNIYDVIFDRNYGVQFTPVLNGTIYQTPLGDSIIAAKRALSGEIHAGESLYFLNPVIATSDWIVNNRKFYKTIGNHDFYL